MIYFFACLAISSSTAVLSSAIVAFGSLAPKTAVPATRTLEPAHQSDLAMPREWSHQLEHTGTRCLGQHRRPPGCSSQGTCSSGR